MRTFAPTLFLSSALFVSVRADTYLNPSGIPLGGTAAFSVSVNPPAFPDALLVWRETPEGAVSYPNGRTGRRVVVRGERAGDVALMLEIKGYAGPAPTIQARVVQPSVVDEHVYVVCSTNGHAAAATNRVAELFEGVNDIWRQACVSFRIASFESVTNDLWLGIPAEDGTWPLAADLVDHAQGTGGVECYFVDRLEDANALNFDGGLVVSTNGNFRAVAHELGHAGGLYDVYEEADGTTLAVTGSVSRATLGAEWGSDSDEGYYADGTQQADLLESLLMYGYGSDVKADIPYGDVTGLWYEDVWDATNRVWLEDWRLSPAPVGFFEHGGRIPSHP